jgi:hypothetical protein
VADLDLVSKERTLLAGDKKKSQETVNKLEIQVISVAYSYRAFLLVLIRILIRILIMYRYRYGTADVKLTMPFTTFFNTGSCLFRKYR